jgi:predicted membrane chloride channel (bestrophin family)
MVYQYDPAAGFTATLTQFSPTVLYDIMQRPEFWFLFAVHLTLFIIFHTDRSLATEKGWGIGEHGMAILAALTTFFEVFYTNQCYKRYAGLHYLTKTSFSTTYAFVFEMRAIMQNDYHKYTRLASRYAMTSTSLHFFEMSETPQEEAWSQLVHQGLCTTSEKEFLEHYPPREQCSIVLHWASDVVYCGFLEARLAPSMVRNVITKLVNIANLQIQLSDTIALPVPFQYFHLLNFMVFMNLLLWAYELGRSPSFGGPIIFFVLEIVFIGMLDVAIQISNPFGRDAVDFDISDWMYTSFRSAVNLMEYNFVGSSDGWKRALTQEVAPRLKEEAVLEWAEDKGSEGTSPECVPLIMKGPCARNCQRFLSPEEQVVNGTTMDDVAEPLAAASNARTNGTNEANSPNTSTFGTEDLCMLRKPLQTV